MSCDTRPAHRLHRTGLMVLSLLLPTLPAHASSQLALDKGCYTCHGKPP